MTITLEKTASELHSEDADARRNAGRLLGMVKSDRKAEAARENGKKGGKECKPLAEIACTCGHGDSLEHPTTCPRGRVIRYRIKKGLPLT